MAKMDKESKKEMSADKKQYVALSKYAFKEHDAQEHKGGKGTKITLKKGGVTGKAMKAVGRNMARAMNQKSSGRGR